MKVASQKLKQRSGPGKGLTAVTSELKEAKPLGAGYVKIYHLQGVKQSSNFQSGDVTYAVELYVEDNPAAIKKGLERAEQIVEDALGDKLPQMTQVLKGLAQINGK